MGMLVINFVPCSLVKTQRKLLYNTRTNTIEVRLVPLPLDGLSNCGRIEVATSGSTFWVQFQVLGGIRGHYETPWPASFSHIQKAAQAATPTCSRRKKKSVADRNSHVAERDFQALGRGTLPSSGAFSLEQRPDRQAANAAAVERPLNETQPLAASDRDWLTPLNHQALVPMLQL